MTTSLDESNDFSLYGRNHMNSVHQNTTIDYQTTPQESEVQKLQLNRPKTSTGHHNIKDRYNTMNTDQNTELELKDELEKMVVDRQ